MQYIKYIAGIIFWMSNNAQLLRPQNPKFKWQTSNMRLYLPSLFRILKYDWQDSGSSPGGKRYMS